MVAISNILQRFERVFRSEEDFRELLAEELKEEYCADSKWELRLKYPRDGRTYVDISLTKEGTVIPIELRYKTAALEIECSNEKFRLKNHGARDFGRYDFLRDVRRVETIVDEKPVPGYAVLLTNDSGYWSQINSDRLPNDDEFRIYEGRTLEGELDWREYREGIPDSRQHSIQLRGRYDIKWREYDYAEFDPAVTNSRFRYLVISVN